MNDFGLNEMQEMQKNCRINIKTNGNKSPLKQAYAAKFEKNMTRW